MQTCVDAIVEFVNDFGITDLVTWAARPGLHPQVMNASLERLIREVVPAVQARIT